MEKGHIPLDRPEHPLESTQRAELGSYPSKRSSRPTEVFDHLFSSVIVQCGCVFSGGLFMCVYSIQGVRWFLPRPRGSGGQEEGGGNRMADDGAGGSRWKQSQ